MSGWMLRFFELLPKYSEIVQHFKHHFPEEEAQEGVGYPETPPLKN